VIVQWAPASMSRRGPGSCSPISVPYTYVSPSDRARGDTRRKAQHTHARGIALMRQKKIRRRCKRVRGSQPHRPGNPEYLNNLGYSEYKTEDFESAVRFFGEAIEADPKRAIAYVNRGDAFVDSSATPKPARITPSSSS